MDIKLKPMTILVLSKDNIKRQTFLKEYSLQLLHKETLKKVLQSSKRKDTNLNDHKREGKREGEGEGTSHKTNPRNRTYLQLNNQQDIWGQFIKNNR